MVAVNPYLNFNGNTEEAFNFYKMVFGGEFVTVMRFKDMEETGNLPEADRSKIMHIALPLGKSNVLMGTDSLESMGRQLTTGNNFYISINTGTKDEADQLFTGLSNSGKVEMPMQDSFWGDYFGMLKDQFGVQWMISFNGKEGE